jgi:GT2 family glycosyltransferase/tetratricopeptide (TPR) repeat protein
MTEKSHKYSIVMLTYNHLDYTVQAVDSIMRNCQDFELIIVDNGSTDGTKGYLDELSLQHTNVLVIKSPINKGVPAGLNEGIKHANGDYIIWVNNDILITPNALEQMADKMEIVEQTTELTHIGMVGPMMNFVADKQMLENATYQVEQVDTFAQKHHEQNPDDWEYAGWLCGSCLMMKKVIFQQIGMVDERFSPGGYEDNDYCLRALLQGWKLIIDRSTFVHHYGSRTFGTKEFINAKWGLRHFDTFINKYREEKPKKLLACYRVKNGGEAFRRSLTKTSEVVDGIIVWNDNSTDNTAEIADECPKVVKIIQSDMPFNEKRDRNAVIGMAKNFNPDWIMVIDHDEMLEEQWTYQTSQKLMHPPNPQILAYSFPFRNFWLSEDYFRIDGTMGMMQGVRMFRNLPEQNVVGGTSIGLHCTSTPPFAEKNVAFSSLCFKHYGFPTEAECQRKYDFYQSLDKEKRIDLIGQTNYSHLISPEVVINKWQPHNTVSFYCLADGYSAELLQILNKAWPIASELVVINTAKNPEVDAASKLFNAKVVPYNEELNFSKMRNFAKSQCNGNWIWTFDLDEDAEPNLFTTFRQLIDTHCDGWLFDVNNFHKDGTYTHTEAVRLFKNIPQFVYEGYVHENFDRCVEENHLVIYKPQHVIYHYGYLKPTEDIQKKLPVYRALNMKQLRENPDDAKAHFNLALHLINEGKFPQAGRHLQKAANLDEKYPHPRIQLAMLHLEGATEQLEDALAMMPPQHRMFQQLSEIKELLTRFLGSRKLTIE